MEIMSEDNGGGQCKGTDMCPQNKKTTTPIHYIDQAQGKITSEERSW
jgi:hypothetical protein